MTSDEKKKALIERFSELVNNIPSIHLVEMNTFFENGTLDMDPRTLKLGDGVTVLININDGGAIKSDVEPYLPEYKALHWEG